MECVTTRSESVMLFKTFEQHWRLADSRLGEENLIEEVCNCIDFFARFLLLHLNRITSQYRRTQSARNFLQTLLCGWKREKNQRLLVAVYYWIFVSQKQTGHQQFLTSRQTSVKNKEKMQKYTKEVSRSDSVVCIIFLYNSDWRKNLPLISETRAHTIMQSQSSAYRSIDTRELNDKAEGKEKKIQFYKQSFWFAFVTRISGFPIDAYSFQRLFRYSRNNVVVFLQLHCVTFWQNWKTKWELNDKFSWHRTVGGESRFIFRKSCYVMLICVQFSKTCKTFRLEVRVEFWDQG